MTQKPESSKSSKGAAKMNKAAKDISDAAATRVKDEATLARDTAAQETDKVANAAHAAADEFDSGSMQAQAIESVARQVDGLADQIRSTDIDRMARMVADAAQRNPLIFVAGAALAGFAATRMLKARDPNRNTTAGTYRDPWQSEAGQTTSAYPAHARSHEEV